VMPLREPLATCESIMPRGHDHTGRSRKGPPFVWLPHFLLDSPAWLELSTFARGLLIEVLRLYNGSNNGRLGLSVRRAAERLNCSKDTAARAFRDLQRLGFLELSIQGAFHRKTSHASEWRLTLHKCDRTGQLPSKVFLRWRPTQKENRGPTKGTDGPITGTVANGLDVHGR
jgi:hypothetical protein